MKPFKILHTEKILDEPFAKVQKERVELPNGNETDWYVNREAQSVVRVFPVLKSGGILMERMYRHGLLGESVEFPAGMIDEGESPEKTAERELLEEVGYKAEELIYLGSSYYDSNRSTAKSHFFLGLGCEQIQESEQEEDEQIEPYILANMDEVEKVLHTAPVTKGEWAMWGYVQSYLKKNNIEL